MNSKIKTIYITFVSIFIIFILFAVMYTFRTMEMYELSSPSYVMDDIISSLKVYNPSSVTLEKSPEDSDDSLASLSENKNENKKSKHRHEKKHYDFQVDYKNIVIKRYDNEEDFYNYLINKLTLGELSYKIIDDSNEASLTYGIYSDDVHIFNVTLNGTNKKTRLGLNIYTWIPETTDGKCLIKAEELNGPYTLYVSVPQDFDVLINNTPLNTEDALLINSMIPDDLRLTAHYVSIPTVDTYEIGGLYKNPSVDVSHFGKKIQYNSTSDNNIYNCYVNSSYETYMADDTIKGIIADAVTLYEKKKYENSHIELIFDDNSFKDYTAYSNMSFSCNVNYTMEIHFNGNVTTQAKNSTYYFAWDIVDDKYTVTDAK